MRESLMLAIVALLGPMAIVIGVTWVLHFFVALKADPQRRATWTVGMAYAIAVAVTATAAPKEYFWTLPFLAAPGAILVFWWWRRELRRAWMVDAPEGVELENDDWRVGLILVAAVSVAIAFKILLKMAATGQI